MKVRIGFGLGTRPLRDETRFGEIVQGLDRLGFDSLWMSERLTSAVSDPLIGLSYAAGLAPKLKIGTNVMVLPGRSPALVAKQLASLDRITNGRLLLAFGLGAPEPAEHQAFGIERADRGPWFNEALPLLRRLWTEDSVDHDGKRFHYQNLTIQPKPVQQPLEVWLGGMAPSELRRIGRLGDGWLPSQCLPAEAAAGRKVIEEVADQHAREIDPEHYGTSVVYVRKRLPDYLIDQLARRRPGVDPTTLVPVGLPAARDLIERFLEAGVSKFVVRPADEPADWTAELEEVAEMLLPLQN
jgi:probable F420-dependent oxidoreductase